MKKIRCALILLLALCSTPSYADEMRLGIELGLSGYPEMEVMPGYPVYYAPQLEANYYFYDGSYWLFQDENWYRSSWYDGPWELVDPEDVPDAILNIPVQYYPRPPMFFFGWLSYEVPHWGEHWGHDWERRRHAWKKWNHRAHQPAPLPIYQREYSGDQYPRQAERQHELQRRHYRYQPRDFEQPGQIAPPRQRTHAPAPGGSMRQDNRPPAPHQQGGSVGTRVPPPQSGGMKEQRQPRAQEPRGRVEGQQDTGTREPKRREQESGRDR